VETPNSAWTAVNFTEARIMIPPEFTEITRNKVVASFINNYYCIDIATRNHAESERFSAHVVSDSTR
jgi:hypothetical protein